MKSEVKGTATSERLGNAALSIFFSPMFATRSSVSNLFFARLTGTKLSLINQNARFVTSTGAIWHYSCENNTTSVQSSWVGLYDMRAGCSNSLSDAIQVRWPTPVWVLRHSTTRVEYCSSRVKTYMSLQMRSPPCVSKYSSSLIVWWTRCVITTR